MVLRDIFDIGAHDGSWSNQVKRIVGRDTRFFLFEPNQHHNSSLKHLDVQFFNALLSDDKKEVNFWSVGGLGDSYYCENNSVFDGIDPTPMTTSTLDAIRELYKLPFPDLLKIDTQGSEIDIVNGALKTLGQTAVVILECPTVSYNIGAPTLDQYIETMRALNFIPIDVTEVHLMANALVQIDIAFMRTSVFEELYGTASSRRFLTK